ncbi:alpha/beta fold hydrolase [Nocardia puris]|uniref:Pimeloyl-ACP methyl ester carboxylesterase n=1 Tax=Nocardia puris TaxID=208602 RepID=A0A366DV87_9NOCA|nr:alpha/beta fold hydrolase [Nocardia puris]MBF6210583.1 alpha/beta fold hydrolase [Nocardia puris]MBF6369308.1 alpha/beta fold hydrolase [Nocardia puris]MBF6457843.1 alpha/beta fold hydrolase [Nocardia puris]RBO94010.1 pimeloyl-ACP methyl ester carboxylesterase [Nocardia puris]
MAKVGGFRNEAERRAYLDAYEAMARQWPVESTEMDVSTAYGPTHVRKSGGGPGAPVVMLHPMGGNGACWLPVIEGLAADRVVYTPDTIGTPGLSVQTAPLTEAADFGKWVDQLLEGLGVERAHLLGYSDGGWQASVAGVSSSRLASLTLVESAVSFGKVSMGVLWRIMRVGIRPTEKNMRKFGEWATPNRPPTEDERRTALAAVPYKRVLPWPRPLTDEELGAIRVPMLAVFGADTVLGDPVKCRDRALELVPRAEVEIYPGTGHEVFFHRADLVVPRICRFLRANEPVPV